MKNLKMGLFSLSLSLATGCSGSLTVNVSGVPGAGASNGGSGNSGFRVEMTRTGVAGFIDGDGNNLGYSISDSEAGKEGRSYECKIGQKGHLPSSFSSCDGSADLDSSLFPNGGTLQVQVRAVEGGVVQSTASGEVYVHPSLNGVKDCPVLDESQKQALLDDAGQFLPQSGASFSNDSGVQGALVTAKAAGVNVRGLSLRKEFTFNASKTLMLITRRYAKRNTPDSCFMMGAAFRQVSAHSRSRNSRDRLSKMQCDAVVMNAEFKGLCLSSGSWTRLKNLASDFRNSDSNRAGRHPQSLFTPKSVKSDGLKVAGIDLED